MLSLKYGNQEQARELLLFLGSEYATLKGFIKPVTSVCFNLEGNIVVGGSVEQTVKLFNLKTQRVIHTFVGHKGKEDT